MTNKLKYTGLYKNIFYMPTCQHNITTTYDHSNYGCYGYSPTALCIFIFHESVTDKYEIPTVLWM